MRKSLVFIHGIGLGEWIFQKYFVPYYRAQGYEVHTFNLPGHTNHSTEAERQKVTLDSCVKFVEEYLATNISSPYVMVGMSMGGAICQRMLSNGFSQRDLSGIVLLSSVPPTNNLVFTLYLCRKLALSNPEILIDFFNGEANPKLVFSPDTLSFLHEREVENYLGKILKGFTRLEYEIFFQNLIPSHFSINVPMKIIGGKDDLLFSPEVTQFTASYYFQQAEILPGLGHMIPFESNYLQGINAVDSFLREVF